MYNISPLEYRTSSISRWLQCLHWFYCTILPHFSSVVTVLVHKLQIEGNRDNFGQPAGEGNRREYTASPRRAGNISSERKGITSSSNKPHLLEIGKPDVCYLQVLFTGLGDSHVASLKIGRWHRNGFITKKDAPPIPTYKCGYIHPLKFSKAPSS